MSPIKREAPNREETHFDEENRCPVKPDESKVHAGPIEQLMMSLENRYNFKRMLRMWGPYLDFLLRLLLLATFIDDSVHTALNFSQHEKTVNPYVLFFGICAQILGTAFLLALYYPKWSVRALIVWLVVQPVLYKQLSNFDFLADSITLMGGLLLLESYLLHTPMTHLFGRMLLPSMYIYHAGYYLLSLEHFHFNNALKFIVLLTVCVLVIIGLRSRRLALMLGFANFGFVFYQHAFFRMIYLEGGEWKYDPTHMSIPNNVVLQEGYSTSDFDLEEVYNVHRYYFFLGLSVSGSLFTLASIGPGDIALETNELLLPAGRAED